MPNSQPKIIDSLKKVAVWLLSVAAAAAAAGCAVEGKGSAAVKFILTQGT